MTATQLSGGKLSSAFVSTRRRWSMTREKVGSESSGGCSASSVAFKRNPADVVNHCHLSADRRKLLKEAFMCSKKHLPLQNVKFCQVSSDCSSEPCDVEDPNFVDSSLACENGVDGSSEAACVDSDKATAESTETSHSLQEESQPKDVRRELITLSLPAIASQAIDPLAQLMETAYIGRLGPVQLGAAGVSAGIFNIISKVFNTPLLSVTTSFVAEDLAKSYLDEGNAATGKPHYGDSSPKQLSSVSTALLLALGIGLLEASAMLFGSGPLLNLMGVSLESPMRVPAQTFLSLRAIGAPAVVLALTLEGILRGFKDTKTPVFCLAVANVAAIFLFPLFITYLQMGVNGAALATVLSQYIGSLLMLWYLSKRVVLLPPKLGDLKFGVYLKSGGFLIGRTSAVLATMTIATSMAARQGPIAMAGHQICMQVWLAVSLLTDALAASGQALVATSLSRRNYNAVKEVTNFVLKIGIYTGIGLAIILGASFGSLANLFTKDADVLQIVRAGTLFVSASQPLNSLAFIFDGLHYGVSDFPYAACSMMLIGAVSSAFLLYAPRKIGLPGVWLGLSLFMGLRLVAGYIRILSKNGPWWFLHRDSSQLVGNYHLGRE